MDKSSFIEQANRLGSRHEPFLFIIDFLCQTPQIYRIHDIPEHVIVDTSRFSNLYKPHLAARSFTFRKKPVDFSDYLKAFAAVQDHIAKGRTYLLNLTFPTQIVSDLSLMDIFRMARARYKLYYKNEFVVFSPETFITIQDGHIYSHPMKGTIDASLPDAAMNIMNDHKEEEEHNTIVDLIRNDLSMVARDVHVEKFRYLEELNTNHKTLLQVSSKIKGRLPQDYHHTIGDLLMRLLPAGSISGAPKEMTVKIIRENEIGERGFFTGIMGYFDGWQLDSGVMIRFIEKVNGQLYFRSGGGLTYQSEPEKEYQEMIDKVYVPVY